MSVATQLQRAHAFEQRGQLAEAVASYKRVLDREPSNTDALFLLGRAYCETGRFQDGAALFRKVVKLNPKHAPGHTLLGRVLAQNGDLQEALASYDRALAADPRNAMAFANKADTLDALGRHAEAIDAYDKALALDPSNLAAWCNRGSALQQLERNEEAVESFRRALALKPDMVEAHFNLANALRTLERSEQAAVHYRRAIALRQDFAEAYINLATVLMNLSRWEEMLQCCETVAKLRPDAVPYFTLSHALEHLDRYDESLAAIDKLLATEPGHTRALYQKSRLLHFLGRGEEARILIERVIEIDPDDIEHYMMLGFVDQFKLDDQKLKTLLDRLRSAKPVGIKQEVKVNFALANLSRRAGQHEEAFQYLVKANTLARAQIDYDVGIDIVNLDRIREVFTPTYLRSMAGHGDPSERPIFIVGMPRSGTTLTEQILAAHPRVYGAGEITDFNKCVGAMKEFCRFGYPAMAAKIAPADLVQLGAAYIARVSALASSADRITNKDLASNVYLGLIHLALPNTRIIHVRRDPVDTCMSCFSMNFADVHSVPFACDLRDLGLYYRAYEKLAAYWAEVLPAGVMLEIQYEDVVDDLEGQARRIVAHCGLEWDERCLAFHKADRPVRTASVAQVRQPIYRSSIGRWKPYREHIQPLLEALKLPDDAA